MLRKSMITNGPFFRLILFQIASDRKRSETRTKYFINKKLVFGAAFFLLNKIRNISPVHVS